MKKKVLFVAFEGLPFIKTGGLADVIYALPKALDKEKYEVQVVLPLHKKIKEKWQDKFTYLDHFSIISGYINEEANVLSLINEGIEYLFIENDTFFNRDNVYGYGDDACRYSFFNVAVLEMMIKLELYPDIIHTHDYHTAVLPALCKYRFNLNEKIARIKHIFTIHNLAYQGWFSKQVLFDFLAFDYKYFDNGLLRYDNACNFMKIGIECADIVTTVSETYAQEIKTWEGGNGLDSILSQRAEKLYGIVNGIDTAAWNPETDTKLAVNYNADSVFELKVQNKLALQKKLELKEDKDALLIGMVSRLTFQKGAELLLNTYSKILEKNVQIAILGTGEERFESGFRYMEEHNKGKAVYYNGYNDALAHEFYGGLDILMMPSLFEPCGISQLIAMRYGTLPLVRETGGLKDTVEPYNEFDQTGRGFSFGPYNADDMLKVLDIALDVYENRYKDFEMLITNAMKYDVSFDTSARKYEDLYKKLTD